ncbi:Pkinase_Tyr domain-containing protein/Malectin_like domain-containing protein [Cephalotus follicularis]|uniref:non-specific serine/threonine protein kinase n=1 Tax=Cephalotus follicularis TaxID=3775 RepID=A0A1Q3D1B1_CEPFO|nr:Pkinase_Tyr domain-containing protein/Malectin_like domain-containing protein [Cephalotus follicularis]
MFTHRVILFSLVCIFVLFDFHHVISASESYMLSCGSADGGTDADGQKWEPDIKYLTGNDAISARATYQDPSLVSLVPYMEARIFTKEATYTFAIKSKQRYMVRFHFYPATYTGLEITKSFFSVVAGGVTLMSNFSAATTAQALTQAYLIREYALAPLDIDSLSIIFKPAGNDAFAFVNGIEVIPMPDMFDSAVLVGFSDQSVDAKATHLQTMFRLNVAGQYIPPSNDSGGLARAWYDDAPYVFGAALGVNLEATPSTIIQYEDLPGYVAPVDVYRTARAMGPTKDINQNFNMTWLFPVDANFTYIVRLHFCEFQLSKVNQRVFNIYINNQSAQADPQPADIIAWTGAKAVPTYKDYAVFVGERQGDEEIRLEMNPSKITKPEYYDTQLNGLEIFKINDANRNLAGPNPEPSEMLIKAEEKAKSFDNKSTKAQVIGGAAAFGLVAAICIAVYQRSKRIPGTDSHTSSWLPIYANTHTSGSRSTISGKSNVSSHLLNIAQGLCRRFSLPEMKQATKNFDESYVIGVGGFGKVYKGVVDSGTKVAIKRSNPSSEQGVNEFQTEIEMLSKLRHKHLVSLIGFCEEDGEMCLIYDYMALGTLREHLYKCNNKSHLPWKQRLEICIGAARGLHYLHTGARYTIIHRDVKTTNILLDENWVAKVSDFGLSKTGPEMSKGHVSTVVKGSFGYLDPEYFKRQQLTEKSDVYSFGVVLFEVLCARPALNPKLPKEQVSLGDYALYCQRKGTLGDIIDPYLQGKIHPECLKKFADTAEKCLADQGIDRPSMGDVLWNLEFALQLQESADISNRSSPSDTSTVSDESDTRRQDMGLNANNLSHENEQDMSRESDDHNNSSDIFSQLVNPKGR